MASTRSSPTSFGRRSSSGPGTGTRTARARLRQDLGAVTAGLTLLWSSGVVEGHVNRVKTLKRAMYGRASFDPLRTRILNKL